MLLIVSILWCTSLVFRSYHISNYPPVNIEAHLFLLKTYHIWQNETPIPSLFAMKHTYQNPGDKFVTYYARLMDKNGNNYYVSHPPFTQMFLWILGGFGIFPLFSIHLQIFLVIIHLLTTLVLALLVYELTDKKSLITPLLASGIFIFHPLSLYTFTHHFFAETLGLSFTIFGLFLIHKFHKQQIPSSKFFLILMILFFLGFCLTDWMGYMFLAGLYLTSFQRRPFLQRNVLFAATAGALLAGCIFCIQHIVISDLHSFVKALGIRFVERSGFFGQRLTDMRYSYDNILSYSLLFKQIAELFKGTGILFIPALVGLLRKKYVLTADQKLLISVSLWSSLMFSLLLFSATIMHYVYMSKWLPFLLIISSLWLQYAFQRYTPIINKTSVALTSIIVILIFIAWSIIVYKEKTHHHRAPNKVMLQVVDDIQQFVSPEQAILVSYDNHYHPATVIWLSYQSQRNIAFANDSNIICEKNKYIKGYVLYHMHRDGFTRKIISCR